VAGGQCFVRPGIASLVVEGMVSGAGPSVSPGKALSLREREVLQLLAEGRSSKETALQLGIAVPTVETHRRQIMDKLELRSIAELTKYAIREGLTSVG
jgi:DNA-binding CsgD family transcriptional regulator